MDKKCFWEILYENAYTADGKKPSRTTNGDLTYCVYYGNVVIEEQNEDDEETVKTQLNTP